MTMSSSDDNESPPVKRQRLTAPPALSGLALELVLRFVLPKDVGRACIVCKTWSDYLTPPPPVDTSHTAQQQPGFVCHSDPVWKQAAKNAAPFAFESIEALYEAEKARSGASEQPPAPPNFRRIAQGLSRGKHTQEPPPPPPEGPVRARRDFPEFPEPEFDMKNLLIIVTLKKEVVKEDTNGREQNEMVPQDAFASDDCSRLSQIRSWEANLVLEKQHKGPHILLEGRSPLNPESRRQLADSGTYGGEMESFIEYYRHGVHSEDPDSEWSRWFTGPCEEPPLYYSAEDAIQRAGNIYGWDEKDSFYVNGGGANIEESILPVGWGRGGAILRQIMADLRTESLHLAMGLRLRAHLPAPGAPDEPKWLREMRKTNLEELDFTEQDAQDMTSIPSFSFNVTGIEVDLKMHNGNFEIPYRICVRRILDGLDWR